MRFFNRIKTIRMKIILSFVTVIFVTWLYSSFNYLQTDKANDNTANLIEQLSVLTLTQQLTNTVNEQIADARGYILTGEQQYKTSFSETTEKANSIVSQLESHPKFKLRTAILIKWAFQN